MNPHAYPLPEKFKALLDKVERVDKEGLVYYLDYNEDYYELENFLSLLVKPGCSTFTCKTIEGEPFMARNYDYTHYPFNKKTEPKDITGLAIVVRGNNPKARFKSIGIADGFWMDQANGSIFKGALDDEKSDISALAFAPFICMDAMNEKGLAVSIMYLPTEIEWNEVDYVEEESLSEEDKKNLVVLEKQGEVPSKLELKARKNSIALNKVDKKAWRANLDFSTQQKEPNKKDVYHTVLMRLMIDNCTTVEEAIGLAQSVNVHSPMKDSDYHILISDSSGKTVVLEWVYEKMQIVNINHSTNYFLSREDQYGYGKDRDDILVAAQTKYKDGMIERNAIDTLSLASQDARYHKEGFTQWSALYYQKQLKLKFFMFMDYDHPFEYAI